MPPTVVYFALLFPGLDRFRVEVVTIGLQCRIHLRLPVMMIQWIFQRGEHNIEHQFKYPTAHGFVFHDSRGFEAGGAVELDKVKDFIENRAKAEQLKDQLHVIWCAKARRYFTYFWLMWPRYCLPISNDNRGMTEAEMSLFESGTGNGQQMHASPVKLTPYSRSHSSPRHRNLHENGCPRLDGI